MSCWQSLVRTLCHEPAQPLKRNQLRSRWIIVLLLCVGLFASYYGACPLARWSVRESWRTIDRPPPLPAIPSTALVPVCCGSVRHPVGHGDGDAG
jgi:hypothetical protein